MVRKIESKEDFDAQLKNAGDKAVIVDFHATWCGPCKMIAPKLAKMATDNPSVVVLKVDVDEVEDVAAECKIEAMPTFVVFKGTKEVERLMGASEEKLLAVFAKYA